MEYAGTLFLIVLFILFIVAIVGGKVKIAPNELTLDTPGFLEYLRKAQLARGTNSHTNNAKVKAKAEKFVTRLSSLPAGIVLWVDDHQTNNINERLALAKLGIHCECYSNNDEAMLAFDQVKTDLIVSDIGRDSGSDGFALLESIRRKSIDVVFIFYTLSPDQDRLEKAKLGGATAIIELPDDLIQEVETCIALRRFRQ